MERRTFLSASGVLALTFAGASDFTGNDTVSEGPTDVVKRYYRRAHATVTADEFADQIPKFAHSASPLPDVAGSIPRVFDETVSQELVSAEVVAEDVSSEDVRDVSDFFAGSVSTEEIETIADENAVVAVTLTSDNVIGGELAKEWLVAPEDDSWRLVWFDERNSPDAAARRFSHLIKGAETLEALDEPVEEGSHSVSPLVNVAEYTPWYFRSLRRQDLVDAEVVAENIPVSEIASEFTPLINWASQDELEAIVTENAVVEMLLRDPRLEVERVEQRWLMAPDNDEWRLVWL